jgi:hypothetical protein
MKMRGAGYVEEKPYLLSTSYARTVSYFARFYSIAAMNTLKMLGHIRGVGMRWSKP